MTPDDILQKQQYIARWQVVDVTFSTANSDVVIPHKLHPFQANDVKFWVSDNPTGGVIYRGTHVAGLDYIVLKATVTGTYHILLFIEVRAKS